MTNRKRYALAAVLLLAVVAWCFALAGCQQQRGATGATTRPSLATLTTQAEAALDAAVNGVTVGRQLGVIDDATFASYIVPSVLAAREATRKMEAAAQAGDQSGWQTASDASAAALAQLRPILDKVQQAQMKGAK